MDVFGIIWWILKHKLNDDGEDIDVDDNHSDDDDDDDDGEVSVGRDAVGQHVGEVCDDDDDDDEDEEDEEESKVDDDVVNGKKNASSTSAYSSFESNEDRGSESSWHEGPALTSFSSRVTRHSFRKQQQTRSGSGSGKDR